MALLSVARDVQRPQDYASDGTDAVGFIQFWGNSPALDLLGDDPQRKAFGPAAIGTAPGQIYKETNKEEAEDAETVADEEDFNAGEEQAEPEPQPAALPEDAVNVLITGGADLRHVVKTLARRQSSTQGRRLRFFLHESHHEVLARHLLFLQIINNTALPVRERMEAFLSIYGNSLVRERDVAYVADIAPEFVELITDNSMHPLASVVNLSHLKFRDRDVLQDIFKGWGKDVPFDVEALREQRCRGYYRERFDYRKNLMDFDYQTYIKPKAGIINWFHYKEFCFTGVAFETRLATYNAPNRTLASYTEGIDRAKGTTVQVRVTAEAFDQLRFLAAMAPAQSPAWRKQFRTQFKKTKLCRFNAVGQCHYGKDCAFAHGAEDLEHAPDLTKTALCPRWQSGECPLPAASCPYAHGPHELRLTPAFAKAKFSNRTLGAEEKQQEEPGAPGLASEGEDAGSEQGSTRCNSVSLESGSTRSQDSPRLLSGGLQPCGAQLGLSVGHFPQWTGAASVPPGPIPLSLDAAMWAPPRAAPGGPQGRSRHPANPSQRAMGQRAAGMAILEALRPPSVPAPPPPPGLLPAAAASPWPSSAPVAPMPGSEAWLDDLLGGVAAQEAQPLPPPPGLLSLAAHAPPPPPPPRRSAQQWLGPLEQGLAGERLAPQSIHGPAYIRSGLSDLLTAGPSGPCRPL